MPSRRLRRLDTPLQLVKAIIQPISPIFKPIILNYARAKRIAYYSKNYTSTIGQALTTSIITYIPTSIIIPHCVK